ncbi:MAG: signal peptidase I, partial [Treponema sp.]|nr:signal peptidase I [Treponema sp.]
MGVINGLPRALQGWAVRPRFPINAMRVNKRNGLFWLVVWLLILVVNRFVFCLAIVNGDSMRDTLRDGDIVIVLRWARRPRAGDIVITNKNNPFHERLVKRVAAADREKGVYLIGDNSGRSRDSREIG